MGWRWLPLATKEQVGVMRTRLQAARAARGLKARQVIAELVRRAEAGGLQIASPTSLQILLSNFENGKRAVGEPYRSLLRAIYGMTDEELFEPLTGLDGPAELAEYAALADRINAGRNIDLGTARMLAGQTDYLRTMDCQLGAPALVDQMAGHLSTVQDALTHAIRPTIRRPLASVLADTAALAAWQALDVGAVNRAWQHHETARYAALEADDPVLLAHAMAQQAFVLVDVGETTAAVELVGEAVQIAGSRVPARFCAWLLAAQAEVLATASEEAASRRGFDRAANVLPNDEAAVDPGMPFIVLNGAHLARWRGNALAQLGDATATDELEIALAGGGAVSTRARASLHCDLARAYQVRGDLDEARKHIGEARRLAKQAGSVRQKQRILRLALAA